MEEHFETDEYGHLRCGLCGDRLTDSHRAKRLHLLKAHREWEIEF